MCNGVRFSQIRSHSIYIYCAYKYTNIGIVYRKSRKFDWKLSLAVGESSNLNPPNIRTVM